MGKVHKIVSFTLLMLSFIMFALFFIYRNNQEYMIVFDTNGGSFINSMKIKYHEKIPKPDDPTRNGFTFVEWQHDGVKYNFDTEVEENILLTALWNEIKSYTVTITLEDTTYQNKFPENSLMVLDNFNIPPREGYNIVIYNNEQVFDLSTPITSDLNLTAQYEKTS